MKAKWLGCLAVLVVSGTVAYGVTPTFQGLGDLPGDTYHSQAYGVSGNGKVVVGWSSSATGSRAFRWTLDGGIEDLGCLDPCPRSYAYAASGDGSVIVGGCSYETGHGNPFIWTLGGGMVALPGVQTGRATDVSSDGSVVVGTWRIPYGVDWTYEAFRWMAGSGPVGLGDLPGSSYKSGAQAVSGDGAVITGYSASSNSYDEAFVWTEQQGMIGLNASTDDSAPVGGVSEDGSVVVGIRWRWTASNGIEAMPSWGDAYDVSGDGSIVVGGGDGAWIWDIQHGRRDFKSVLTSEYGLALDDWSYLTPAAISDNGTVVVGYGGHIGYGTEAFIFEVPEPASATLLLLGFSGLLWRRMRR